MSDAAAERPTPYQMMGGEPTVRALTQRFYALMDSRDDVTQLRGLHPPSLVGSERKLFEYLSGWLGGPPLFESKYGHPRLRARHLPFAIDSQARDQWLACMRQALEETVEPPALRIALYDAIAGLADHMRNTPDT